MQSHYTPVDENLRDIQPFSNVDLTADILAYTAGIVDADGCFKINQSKTTYSLQFSMSQSLKGVAALQYIHHHFGGSINLQLEEEGNNQRAYTFSFNGEDVIKFAKIIHDHLLLKKREAIQVLEFPLGNMHIIPIIANNIHSDEHLEFENLKLCSAYFGKHLAFQKSEQIKYNDWNIQKKLNRAQVDAVHQKRKTLMLNLQNLKVTPHSSIAQHVKPSMAYFGGLFDGDGRLSTHGLNGQNHSVNQKSIEICQLYKRTFGGTISQRTADGVFVWEIYTGAEDFFKAIAPFVVGKKKQVDLISNMKPGEAMDVSVALRELKGKGKPATPKMDRYKESITQSQDQNEKKLKILPKGVFRNDCKNPYRAQIQHDKKIYIIGQYASPDEAHQEFMKVKRMIINNKANDFAIDLSHLSLSSVRKK